MLFRTSSFFTNKNNFDLTALIRIQGLSAKPGKETMKNPIKILHVNKKKEGTYFLIREGLFIRSSVSRKGLKKLLKTVKPDLIISDPSNKPGPEPGMFNDRLFQYN